MNTQTELSNKQLIAIRRYERNKKAKKHDRSWTDKKNKAASRHYRKAKQFASN